MLFCMYEQNFSCSKLNNNYNPFKLSHHHTKTPNQNLQTNSNNLFLCYLTLQSQDNHKTKIIIKIIKTIFFTALF